jgi:hypothetical protein
MQHLLFHDLLSDKFTAEGEELASDLSGVWIDLIKNVHDETLEMTIDIYGLDGFDEDPIVSEFIYDPEAHLGKNFTRPSICPRCIINLFDDKLIDLFIKTNIKIIWNRNWQAEAVLDTANLHLTSKLEAEDQ